jgi:heptose-I-phosphate ethanolaminephosphotransferase
MLKINIFLKNLISSPRFWLWIYIAMLLLPSAIISGDGLGKALYPTVFFLGLFNHFRRFFWLTLIIYIACPFALYYEISYQVPPEVSLWLTLLGSSNVEAGAYLTHLNVPLAIFLLAFYGALLPVFYLKIPSKSFNLPIWLRFACLALIYVPIHRFYEEKNHDDGYLSLNRHYKQSFPINFGMGFHAAKLEISRVKVLVATQNNMQCTQDNKEAAQTIVMVIGESARRDRLGLFGYKLDTTPELSKRRDQLWLFDNAISASFETTSSLPTLLTGHFQDNNATLLHPSFLSAFNSAGYKTYWFSNQAQYGEYDSLVSAYASASKEKMFLHQNSDSISLSTIYDEALLPYLDQALSDKSTQKKLIVLHIYGSHADFSKRYPKEFQRFPDNYDNTILYTDHVLNEIINHVDAQGGQSALLYMSDHGLNLGECPQIHEGHLDIKSNYQVPLIAWASKQWRASNSQLSKRLTAAVHEPLSSETIMPALLTMGHVNCPSLSSQHSLFNPQVSQSIRLVHTFSKDVAYDSGVNNAQCHIVNLK